MGKGKSRLFKTVLTISSWLFAVLLQAQHPILPIPKEASLDSVFQEMYRVYQYDEDSFARSRSFGWTRHSSVIDTDAFFQKTKTYCIDRVGEAYFYKHFRLFIHSFKDEEASHIYTIQYRFYVPGMEGEYVPIVFKSFDFLGFQEEEYPDNLPDCLSNPGTCAFEINKEKAIQIALKEVVKDAAYNGEIKPNQFTEDYKWHFAINLLKKGIHTFKIDARTGAVEDLTVGFACGF